MNIDDIYTLVLAAGCAWTLIGIWEIFSVIRKEYRAYCDEHERAILIKAMERVHRVKIEEVTLTGGGFEIYWFDSDSGKFIAQGKNFFEIVDTIKNSQKDHVFFLSVANKEFVLHGPDWMFDELK